MSKCQNVKMSEKGSVARREVMTEIPCGKEFSACSSFEVPRMGKPQGLNNLHKILIVKVAMSMTPNWVECFFLLNAPETSGYMHTLFVTIIK